MRHREYTYLFIVYIPGYGVFAAREFEKGSFLLEYPGELISSEFGEKREDEYERCGKGNFPSSSLNTATRLGGKCKITKSVKLLTRVFIDVETSSSVWSFDSSYSIWTSTLFKGNQRGKHFYAL